MKTISNKKIISSFSTLFELSKIKITKIHIQDTILNIEAKLKDSYSKCPICGFKSNSVHSYYCRKLQDMPISLRATKISIYKRRFYCNNPQCSRKTFSEQIPYTQAYARSTNRANNYLKKMSLETSARKSSYLSKLTNISVSPSTCLRLINSCEIGSNFNTEDIAIYDWAFRKGATYGTIVVDRKTGKTIDLISSRKKEDIIKWLQNHQNIKSVTRDRAKCYSESIKFALPTAIQIADRFHLVVNFSECMYGIIKNLLPDLKKMHKPKIQMISNNGLMEKEIEEIERIKKLATHQEGIISYNKQLLIKEARRLYSKNISYSKIAKLLGIHKRTVAKYINSEESQINTGRSPRNNYSLYVNDIIEGYYKRECISDIYKNIKNKGFNGSLRGLTQRFSSVFKNQRDKDRNRSIPLLMSNNLNISPKKMSIYLTNNNYKKYYHL